jgi:hypothetical protein
MPKPNHYTVRACAELKIETFSTEKGSEKEFNKKTKIIVAVAKALGIELWVDEVLVEE